MKERPILFSAPMVRAILEGRKTQTRRVMKPQPPSIEAVRALYGDYHLKNIHQPDVWSVMGSVWAVRQLLGTECREGRLGEWRCPYGAPGDRLWVREAWQAIHVSIDPETGYGDDVYEAEAIPKDSQHGYWSVAYRATDAQADYHKDDRGFVWRPGIHMPRWASRITLEVANVRVERVHAIAPDDVTAEGITEEDARCDGECGATPCSMLVPAFKGLWHEINGQESWDANPWVWVVEFKRIQPLAVITEASVRPSLAKGAEEGRMGERER